MHRRTVHGSGGNAWRLAWLASALIRSGLQAPEYQQDEVDRTVAESYQRIIRRPTGVSDSDWSRLGEQLADAVARQGRFAAETPHVLRFLGGLEQPKGGNVFTVEHEPALAMPIGGLYDRSAPTVNESELLRVTVAVFDALRTAHAQAGQQPTAHGAVCPGDPLCPGRYAQGFGFRICAGLLRGSGSRGIREPGG